MWTDRTKLSLRPCGLCILGAVLRFAGLGELLVALDRSMEKAASTGRGMAGNRRYGDMLIADAMTNERGSCASVYGKGEAIHRSIEMRHSTDNGSFFSAS